jgi:hypothetical protein
VKKNTNPNTGNSNQSSRPSHNLTRRELMDHEPIDLKGRTPKNSAMIVSTLSALYQAKAVNQPYDIEEFFARRERIERNAENRTAERHELFGNQCIDGGCREEDSLQDEHVQISDMTNMNIKYESPDAHKCYKPLIAAVA